MDLEDGSGLKLTIARYFTPNEKDIQEKGITPDIIIEPTKANLDPDEMSLRTLREKDLKGHLRNINGDEESSEEDEEGLLQPKKKDSKEKSTKEKSPEEVEDVQLKAALDYLKTWEIFKHHAINQVKSPTAKAPGEVIKN
jgi:carboxyl-terminal processing protease